MLVKNMILNIVGIISCTNQALATSLQTHPSGYAYHDDSVSRAESASANCRRYQSGLQAGVYTERYIHCDGTQRKLTDSDVRQEQYQLSDYYQWTAGSDEQLLFVFSTRVSLTIITLHYYRDHDQGLPRLRYYAVPDNFDIWDALSTSYPHVDVAAVPSGREPSGRRNVSINVNFNTKKVLMFKFSSAFKFTVSEVEFFICISTTPSVPSFTTDMTTTTTMDNASKHISTNNSSMNQDTQDTTAGSSLTPGNSQSTVVVVVGVAGALLLILIIFLIITLSLLLWHHKRRAHKSEKDPNLGSMREDAFYSTLERGTKQHTQPQTSIELYDQIHLSPSTGQTELISKTENETAGDISTPISDVYSSVDTEKSQPISSFEKSNLEDATYAVVDKKKKKKKLREASDNLKKSDRIDAENFVLEKEKEQVKAQNQLSLEEMYAVVHKKPKKSEEQEETAPSIPAYTVESLYTAVQKMPQ